MLDLSVIKHAREFLRYMRNFQYERTDTGISFPRANLSISGVYTHWVNDEDPVEDTNLIVDQGLIYLLNVGSAGGTQISSWYLAPFNGGSAVGASWTAANFTSNAQEITSGSEGYSEANRVLWDPDSVDVAGTYIENLTTPGSFTIVTASTLTVTGAGLLSANGKGATTGTLLSATRFAAARTLNDTDVFNVRYRLDFNGV